MDRRPPPTRTRNRTNRQDQQVRQDHLRRSALGSWVAVYGQLHVADQVGQRVGEHDPMFRRGVTGAPRHSEPSMELLQRRRRRVAPNRYRLMASERPGTPRDWCRSAAELVAQVNAELVVRVGVQAAG